MYITRVEIENIRSIKHLVWEIDAINAPGWHVILGDNGSGKSTFVRAVALAIIGERQAEVIRQDWTTWGYKGKVESNILLRVYLNEKFDLPEREERKISPLTYLVDDLDRYYVLLGISIYKGFHNANGNGEALAFIAEYSNALSSFNELLRSNNFTGFSCSFGPFRRFTGGDPEEQKLFEANLRYTRHLSAFSEKTALSESLRWLQQLRFKGIDPANTDSSVIKLLENIEIFVNQKDFLPYDARLTDVTSSGVRFQDGNGNQVFVEEMSDGYRSVLSLTFELLRQLSVAYGPDIFETHEDGKVTVKVPGVVQIDEVDAHLHPTWQKRIGFWFREHFPQMQFIVTTHSLLVCQAAEKGSIFLLPRPGTEETGRMLEGAERDRLIYGDITDAYSTEAFGGGDTRSPAGQAMLERLGELNVKEMLHGLTKAEEQERLRLALPFSATELP